MPVWKETPTGDGVTEHALDGRRLGAIVQADVALRRTVISVAVVVDGADEATVDRCKRRAEQMLAAAHGEVR